MSNTPVKEGDSIMVGTVHAIVSTVFLPDRVEIVYLNQTGRAVAENAIRTNGKWQFESNMVDATYADGSDRLRKFAAQLKSSQVA